MAFGTTNANGLLAAELDAHTNNKSNPHSVTAKQIGAAAESHTHTSAQITDRQNETTQGPLDKYSDSLITSNTLAYWNGGYDSNNHSNLAYCKFGALGNIVTQSTSTYAPASHTHTIAQVSDLQNQLNAIRAAAGGSVIKSIQRGVYDEGAKGFKTSILNGAAPRYQIVTITISTVAPSKCFVLINSAPTDLMSKESFHYQSFPLTSYDTSNMTAVVETLTATTLQVRNPVERYAGSPDAYGYKTGVFSWQVIELV